ncbi:membrane protein insertion efficiency factor YidD [Tahibacter aquaticus]|uniref:membrane protein insertion efficiency factor YidD n=1 Tax=Tahibacter aquaticus TaxID=520092 RepID=UPI00105FF7D4|nr:membrane protein insertion efficiency factor YidD [Tahibacter aquaticus]
MTRLILYLLGLYKRLISPLFGARCRYHPSCSHYARVAVSRHGAARGSLLAAWRLLRCNPFSAGGFDYVPEHFTLRRQPPPPPSKE